MKYRSTLADPAPVSGLAIRLDQAFTVALLVTCAVIVVRRLDDLPVRRRGALVVMLGPWAYVALRDLYQGQPPTHLAQLIYPAVVTAIWALQPRLQSLALLGYLAGATGVLSLVLAVVTPDKGLYRAVSGDLISPDKEIFPWGVLIGPFTDSNNLGQVLVLGFPALLLVPNRMVRALLSGCTAFAIVWTASRSSLAAMAIGLVVASALGLVRPSQRRGLALGLLVVLLGILVLVPLMTTNDLAFTNRGAVWIGSLAAWRTDPVFGLGSEWYAAIAPYVSGLGDYAFHAHNQFVQTLVVGGLCNVTLVGMMLAVVTRDAVQWAGRGVSYPAVSLATFTVSCMLEVSFGVVDRDFLLAVTYLPLAFTVFGVTGGVERPSSGATATTDSGV